MSTIQDLRFRNAIRRRFLRRPGLREVNVTRALFPGPTRGATGTFLAGAHYPNDEDLAVSGINLQGGDVVFVVWVGKAEAPFRLNEQDWITDQANGIEYQVQSILKRQYMVDPDGLELIDRVLLTQVRTETAV